MRLAVLACLAALALPHAASAQSVVETARQWNLIGAWAADCLVGPSQARPWLIYAPRNGKLYLDRDYGGRGDTAENQIVSATRRADGAMELVIRFNSMSPPHTRLNVLVWSGPESGKESDQGRDKGHSHDTYRALESKDLDSGAYSIRDGRFVPGGQPAAEQHRCRGAGPVISM